MAEAQKILSFLEKKPEPTSEESISLSSLKEKIRELEKNLCEKVYETKKRQQKEISSANVETHPEIVVDSKEYLETNQSQKEEFEMQNLESKQTTQIQQVDLPYSTLGSSK